MTVFEATGGRFNDPDAEVSNDEVGTLTVEFTSCTEGTAEYDLTVGGEELEGSFDIERISPVVDCTATFEDDNI